MCRDADRSDGSTRLAIILYYDDVEVVNPIGAFHGTHKLGLFYWALVNIATAERMALQNLHLQTVALVSDINYYGIQQIVSGHASESTSFGASMPALDKGIMIQPTPSQHPVLVCGWCVPLCRLPRSSSLLRL